MSKELDKELRRIARVKAADNFRRDHHLIPADYIQLKRIDKMIRDLPLRNNVRKIK